MKCLLRTISVCSPSVAAWAVRDSLPCQDKVSAACLFTGTMPLRAGKEGTLNHSGHDRRTPHTHSFLWERSAPGYRRWVCPRGMHATGQVGPSAVLKGPLVLTGFCTQRGEGPTLHPNTYQPAPTWTISRVGDTNKQGKDVGKEDKQEEEGES